MTTRSEAQILRELAEVMRQAFPDRDYSGPVEAGTRVFADIGLASIEVVVLGERLEKFYGQRLPFAGFLSSLRSRNATDLELGDLVAFLQQHVSN